MTASNDRWAKYGKLGRVIAIVVAVVVGAANLDGFLSMVERITGSSDTSDQPTSARTPGAALSLTQAPAAQPTLQDTKPTPQTQEQPAQRPPTTAQRQPATAAAEQPKRAGALVINIKMGSSGKVGPSEYRAGATPGANVDVFDDMGQLSAGCYPSWVLTRAGTEVQKLRNTRCTSGGITMFNFGDSLDTPGAYRLSVDIVTDAGQKGSSSVDFQVG
ncbi:hypothetical protein [Lentzea sp. NPDC092896]|uniref:hypothetical protein n=1 Tax=Lentzea sp. NPDC092896 TaxID=3364127 RepID=UPI00381D0561